MAGKELPDKYWMMKQDMQTCIQKTYNDAKLCIERASNVQYEFMIPWCLSHVPVHSIMTPTKGISRLAL